MTESEKIKCTGCRCWISKDDFNTKPNGNRMKTCTKCQERRAQMKDAVKEYNTQYYQNNKEHIKEVGKEYIKSHPEVKKKSTKKYYEKNKQILNKKTIEYQKTHREQANASTRKHHRNHHKIDLNYIVKEKLNDYRKADKLRNREITDEFITVDWVIKALENCNNKCEGCGIDMKLISFDPLDNTQFTVDRKDNSIAHLKDNCWILCLQCNRNKH